MTTARQLDLLPATAPVPVEECARCGFLRPVRAIWGRTYLGQESIGPVCGPCAGDLAPVLEARGDHVAAGVPRGGLL